MEEWEQNVAKELNSLCPSLEYLNSKLEELKQAGRTLSPMERAALSNLVKELEELQQSWDEWKEKTKLFREFWYSQEEENEKPFVH